ncbi:MAG TPA: AsmA family protein [Chitinophagaceae bacterium]|nr:AsmA family protein [Chitinophagaceae bacterium]
MKKARKILLKSLKYTGITVGSLLLLLLVLPYLFPKTIANGVKVWTNNNINGRINFSKINLSFYDHFPSLTLTLQDFSLKGSVPYPDDTLIAANEIAFGVNLRSVFFEQTVKIDEVYLDDALLNVQVDSLGNANYNILKTKNEKQQEQVSDSGSASLKIQKIQISNCHLVYHDRSIPMFINADGFNYKGKGDLSNAIFDLSSELHIKALDFGFDGEDYLRDKEVKAKLLTQVNTQSLVLLFRQNDLNINKLKLDFSGDFKFLSNGYSLDLKAGADNIKLYSLITALPPKYLDWLKQTEVKGDADLLFTLKGDYIASQNLKPDVRFNMNIRDGFVAYHNNAPASGLQFRLKTVLPALNTDSLRIDIDTFAFHMDKDYFDARVHTLGLDSPHIRAQLKMDMDLDKLQHAIGYNAADFKGRFGLDVTVAGRYKAHTDKAGQSVIDEVPGFTAKALMSNGYFKMAQLPQGISNINFTIEAACSDGNYRHSKVHIDGLKATALNNFVQGRVWVDNLVDFPLDADFHSKVNLAELKSFIPMDSLSLAGLMVLDVTAKGNYVPERKQFPVIKLDLDLKNGSVQTKYYPRPVSNIQAAVSISDPSGTARDLAVSVSPLSFEFEGKPFMLDLQLANMADVRYKLLAKGELDLARIYSVFSQKDLDVSGYAKVDLNLSGTQSDAMKGRYSRLHNEGSLALRDILVKHSVYLPLPFLLQEGLFRFRNDKFWFERFRAKYGRSDIQLNGYLLNVINYALSDKEKLKGSFTLQSNYLLVDQFIPNSTAVADTSIPDTSGVIVIPANLAVSIQAKVKRIDYDGLHLQDFAGQLAIDSAQLRLKQTGFSMIGTTITMDALYKNVQTKKALFDFAIVAKDFDVRRAYKEVKLFHDMAPAAASAQGIISLDYKIKGRLDSSMGPVYPSLEGGGVLSVRNVQFKGFKLLNNASRESGREGLKDPDVKNVDLKTTIKNNIISLEKVKIKMAGFRLRVEGQSDFDHNLKFKMRLGLPPLGIIGIPMTVSGTSDNPKVKVGKENSDPLEEKEDEAGAEEPASLNQ